MIEMYEVVLDLTMPDLRSRKLLLLLLESG
jgi:hypothetical protein